MNPTVSIKDGKLYVRWVNYIMWRAPRKAIVEAIYDELLPGVDKTQYHRLQFATVRIYKTGVEVTIPTPSGEQVVKVWTGEHNRWLLEERLKQIAKGKLLADCQEGVLTP